jgi:hypothetical protein
MHAYLRNPFNARLIHNIRAKLIENVRDIDKERQLPYHTYPPKSGNLESSCHVTNDGVGHITLGSDLPYASILEFGRAAQHRTKKPFVFEGYYPNPWAIKQTISHLAPSQIPANLYKPFKKSVVSRTSFPESGTPTSVPGLRGTRQTYNRNLSGTEMKNQNVHFITKILEGDIALMKWRPGKSGHGEELENYDYSVVLQGKGSSKSRTGLAKIKRDVEEHRIPEGFSYRRNIPALVGKKKVMKSGVGLKYGIYTVFAYHTKAIPDYRVFEKTAEWAKEVIIKKVKANVRSVGLSGSFG